MTTLNNHIEDLLRRNPEGLSVPSMIEKLMRPWGKTRCNEIHLDLAELIIRDRVQCIPGPTDETTIYKWIPQ